MPRTGGSYALPSPPMPLVPGTLAKAEDLNTVLSDIGTALTGSMPADGSLKFNGTLDLNGNDIIGVDGFVANNVYLGDVLNTPSLVVTGTAEISALAATSGYITTLTAHDLTVPGGITATDLYVSTSATINDLNIQDVISAPTAEVSNLAATNATIVNLLVTGTATGPFLAELRDEVRALRERVADLEAMLVR